MLTTESATCYVFSGDIFDFLMTALTTILAMVPLALGVGTGAEIRYPMARAVVGGLSTSTVLTLVVVPVVYTIFENFADRRKKRRAEKAVQRWGNGTD